MLTSARHMHFATEHVASGEIKQLVDSRMLLLAELGEIFHCKRLSLGTASRCKAIPGIDV